MKFVKRVGISLVFGVLLLSLAACSSNVAVKEPKELAKIAASNIEKIESLKMVMLSDLEMNGEGEISNATERVEMDINYTPLNVKIVNKNNLNESNSVESTMETYMKEQDGTITQYSKYAGQWTKQSMEKDEGLLLIRSYDARSNLKLFLQSTENWTEISKEKNVITLEGIIPANTMKTISEETRSLQMVGMAGLTPNFYDGISDTKITVTIDETTGMPVGYKIDLKEILQVLMDNVMKSFSQEGQTPSGVIIDKYTLEVICSDINKAIKIEVPKEALDTAVDFEAEAEAAEIEE